MQTERVTEGLAVADYILPTNASAGTVNSVKGIDTSKFGRIFFLIQVGVVASSGTLNVVLQSSASATFASGVHNMTNGAINQVTASNTMVTIETRPDAVINENAGDRYVRLQCITAVGTVYYGVVGFGAEAVEKPGGKNNILNTTILSQQLIVDA
jgi:hypothetical protein